MNYNDMKFYTVEEVANKLRVPQSVLMELIRNKALEAVNVGDTGIWIVEEQCILELLYKGNNRNKTYKDCNEVANKETVCITGENEASISIINLDEHKKTLLQEIMSSFNLNGDLEVSIRKEIDDGNFTNEQIQNHINKEFDFDNVIIEENNFNNSKLAEETLVKHNKSNVDNPIVISESDIVKHKNGDYVANNKFFNEENVIAEFIFDAEQAKKPVTDEIVFSKLDFDENVHICDDQEANERLLRLSNGGNLLEEKKKGKGGKGKKSLNFNKEPGRKLRKNFVIEEELIEKLKSFRDNTGESMSNIVEEALSMFFKSKVELGQAL